MDKERYFSDLVTELDNLKTYHEQLLLKCREITVAMKDIVDEMKRFGNDFC